jgi:hypothetical protein
MRWSSRVQLLPVRQRRRDELTVRVQNSQVGQPHAVILGSGLEPITFPSNDQAYAQETLDAWLNRNDVRPG